MTDLGDRRLNRRASTVAAAMAADPSGSIPRQCGGRWSEAKGAYRLFDHERATFESLSASHWRQTRQRCGAHPLVLLIQDTTFLDYSAHPQTEGLGWHGRSEDRPHGGSGLLMHGVLAVAPSSSSSSSSSSDDGTSGQVLGLAHNKLWARTGERKSRSRTTKRSARRRSDDRESLRWAEAVKELGAAPAGVRWLYVGDREGDIFDVYEQTRRLSGVGFLIRVQHDRNVRAGHDDTPETLGLDDRKGSSLKRLLRSMPVLAEKRLWVAPKQGRAGRWVRASVSATAVTVYSPQLDRTGRALRCWAVRVWEEHAAAAAAGVGRPLEWMLLTTLPADTVDEALRITEYYGLRWLIEEYHKCLKSGCRVEERQLESADRLAPLIGMLCVVAVRLLQLKNDARSDPEAPAEHCVPAELVRTMARLLKVAEPRTLSVRRFVHEVAKRGGFLGRTGDGEPGYLTLWRGWQQLMQIHLGYQLAEQLRDVGNA